MSSLHLGVLVAGLAAVHTAFEEKGIRDCRLATSQAACLENQIEFQCEYVEKDCRNAFLIVTG